MDFLAFRPFIRCHDILVRTVWRASSLALLILLWFATAASGISSDQGTPLEYSVKGAYLIKFAAFVEWPAVAFSSPEAPLVIGVLGDSPFNGLLEQMAAGQAVGNRPVVVLRTQRIDQARSAHILFISQSEEARMDLIQSHLRGSSVLTVADFEQPGIIIHFMMENRKVRFAVHLDQAQRAGLKLNSRLLAVATTVHKD